MNTKLLSLSKTVQPLNYFISTTIHSKDAQIFRYLSLRYGFHLERLDCERKLELRAILTRYLYYKCFISNYLIVDAIVDTLADFNKDTCAVLLELQGLSDPGAEVLIGLVTA